MTDLKKTMREIATFSEEQRQVQLKKLEQQKAGERAARTSLTDAIIVAYEKVIASLNHILRNEEEEQLTENS